MHDDLNGGDFIKISQKIILLVAIFFMINIVFSENLYALPKGVERVNIDNWMKTRDVDETEGDDKKLNAVGFENIENIGLGDDKVQLLETLYQYNNKEMRSVKGANDKLDIDKEKYKGNKVLRTYLCGKNDTYAFSFANISTWLREEKSLNNAKWTYGDNDSKYITWPCYSKYQGSGTINETSAEYRMLSGVINLTNAQLLSISKKEVQAALGVSTSDGDGFETIIPFNDIVNIFINNQLTPMNYIVSNTEINKSYFKINYISKEGVTPKVVDYKYESQNEVDKFCNQETHKLLSSYGNVGHVDLNVLRDNSSGGIYDMNGNINQYLTNAENRIDILIGKINRQSLEQYEGVGGISKLDLFLIETPKLEINLKPYFIVDDKKKYLDQNYEFSCGEEVYFDVEIKNNSQNFSLDNLKTDINFIIGDKEKNAVLNINKDKILFRNEDITNNIEIYKDDRKVDLESLKSIKQNEKITLSSNKIRYEVSEYNSIKKLLEYNYVTEFNYLNEYMFYKYEKSGKYKVKELKGKLEITMDCLNNCEDYFYVNIECKDNSCNLKIKENTKSYVYDLDLNKDYEVSLLNSSNHKNVNNQVIRLNQNESRKSIKISTSCKQNNYFTQRTIEELKINR